MPMNISDTMEELPALQGQRDEPGKAAGAATMRSNSRFVERHRGATTVAWTADTRCWQQAVLSAVVKLGLEAALTGVARAEVDRCLERGN